MLYVVDSSHYELDDRTTVSLANEVLQRTEWSNDHIVRHLVGICGRYHYGLQELSCVVSACDQLIVQLVQLPFDSFSPDQWAAIVLSLGSDVPLPLPQFESYVQEENPDNQGKGMALAQASTGTTGTQTSAKRSLCRRNQQSVLSHGLLSKLIHAVWPEQFAESCLANIMKGTVHTEIPIVHVEAANIRMCSSLLAIDWVDMDSPVQSQFLRMVSATALSIISQWVRNTKPKCAAAAAPDALRYCSSVHERSLSLIFMSSTASDTVHTQFIKQIALQHEKMIQLDSLSSTWHLLFAVEVFVAAARWIPRSALELPSIKETSWGLVLQLLHKMEAETLEKKRSDDMTTDDIKPIVTLASPEDDETTWLDTLLESVPVTMDKKAADDKFRSELILKMENLICHLMFAIVRMTLPIPQTEHDKFLQLIMEVYGKMSLGYASHLRSRTDFADALTLTFGEFNSYFKSEVIRNCVDLVDGPLCNPEPLLSILMCTGEQSTRGVVASIYTSYVFDNIKETFDDAAKENHFDNNYERVCSPRLLSLFRLGRRALAPQFVTQLANGTMKLFGEMCINENVCADLVDKCVLLLHILCLGGGQAMPLIGFYSDNDLMTAESLRPARPNPASTGMQPNHLRQIINCPSSLDSWTSGIRHFAQYSLSRSSLECPPLLVPLFSLSALESEPIDFATAVYLFRLTPFYRSTFGQDIIRAFLGSRTDLYEQLETYYSDGNLPMLFTKLLEHYEQSIPERGNVTFEGQQAMLDCLLIAISFKIHLSPSLVRQYSKTLEKMNYDQLQRQCSSKSWECPEGSAQMHNVFAIYRNPLLHDSMSYQKMVEKVVSDQVVKEVEDEKLTPLAPHYNPATFDLRSYAEHRFALSSTTKGLTANVYRSFRSEMATYIIETCAKAFPSNDVCKELVRWSVITASSAYSHRVDAESANTILETLPREGDDAHGAPTPAQRAFSTRLLYALDTLLAGSMCTATVQTYEKTPLSRMFSKVLRRLYTSTHFAKPMPQYRTLDMQSQSDVFDKWLQIAADGTSSKHNVTPTFLRAVVEILRNSSRDSDPSRMLRSLMARRLRDLPSWIRRSACPTAVLAELEPLVEEILRNKEEVDLSVLSDSLTECAPLLIVPQLVENLQSYFEMKVQNSDRFGQACLNYKGAEQNRTRISTPHSALKLRENRPIFQEALGLLCKYGNSKTHQKILELCCDNGATYIGVTDDQCHLICADQLVDTYRASSMLVFRMMVSTALLSYSSQLMARLVPASDKGYFSDSESLKDTISRRGGAAALPPSMQKPESESKVNLAKLCTYSSTDKQFILQHWYNCYTCDMVDTVGVCSVCAANCHKGHDLVYSKLGSFFCDCGAGGCSSLKNVQYSNAPITAARGRPVPINSPIDITDSDEKNRFQFPTDLEISREFAAEQMAKLWTSVENQVELLELAMKGVVTSHLNKYRVQEKREQVVRGLGNRDVALDIIGDKTIMEEFKLDKHYAVAISRRLADATQERTRGRNLSGTIRLESGGLLWLLVDGTTLYIHHIQNGKNMHEEIIASHVDLETLPFPSRRMTCMDDKVAIIGKTEVLLLRFGRDGDVVDRNALVLGDIVHTNPIVAAVWAPGLPAVIAVATVQFVRVYDITLDTEKFLEELVLPVGNVEDIQFAENLEGLVLLILSSARHLYRHILTTTSADKASFFMTNCHDNPPTNTAALSFHYSAASQLLFVSHEDGTWFTNIPDGNFAKDYTVRWRKLQLDQPLHCWQEASGVIGALSYSQGSPLIYLYPKDGEIIMQRKDLNKRIPYTHTMFTAPTNDRICALVSFYDSPSIFLSSDWHYPPDLWIKDLPLELHCMHGQPIEDPKEDTPRSELATLMERCEVIERVEASCPDLLRYYDNHDLNIRLQTVGSKPISPVQMESFRVELVINEPNMVIRAVRIEVPASPAQGPREVVVMGIKCPLTSTKARFFDIPLSRSQSLELRDAAEATMSLVFTGPKVHSFSVVSVRLFGISGREFGFPRAQVIERMPLSLIDANMMHTVRCLTTLAENGMFVKDREFLLRMADSMCSYRNVHKDIVKVGNHLLRSLMQDDMRNYYDRKDTILFRDIKLFIEKEEVIPYSILPEMATQIKYMLCTRFVPFTNKMNAELGGSLPLMRFLYNQLPECSGEPMPLLELFVALLFAFLSHKDPKAKELTKIFLDIFTDPKRCHLAYKVRLVAQSQIYSYALSTKTDRQTAKTLVTPQPVMQWGGIRPFFNKTKILSPEEDAEEVAYMMGPLLNTETLLEASKDIFDFEAGFIVDLLQDVLVKIRDEGSIGSMPQQGVPHVRSDSVPSTSLLIFSIVLLAQLHPNRLLPTVVQLIKMIDWKTTSVEVSEENYRKFLLVRLLLVLLGRYDPSLSRKKEKERKSSSPPEEETYKTPPSTPGTEATDDSWTTISTTTSATAEEKVVTPITKRRPTVKLLEQIVHYLVKAGVIRFCLDSLQLQSHYWRHYRDSKIGMKLWSAENPPMNSDIGGTTVQGKAGVMDAQEYYLTWITDVCLRLPLQMKYITRTIAFDDAWIKLLCEFASLHKLPNIRKQSRRLLIAICEGDKVQYKSVRDRHQMSAHLDLLKKKFTAHCNGPLTHQQLTEMVELVSAVSRTAASRPAMWRTICEDQLNWLLQLACRVADPVSGNVLELLVAAIREETPPSTVEGEEYAHLADRLIADDDNRALLKMLLVRYLIGREETRRWLMHGMLRSTIQLAARQNQATLVRILWSELWPLARNLGSHGAQLADLLASYLPRLLPPGEMLAVCDTELAAIQEISTKIEREGHHNTYRQMIGLGMGWKSMLMVTSPCLNCFSRKETMDLVKMTAIKQDARFSSNAMMMKLLGHYEISKVVIKLSDLKRSKQIKKITLNYYPKVTESAVELKSSVDLCQRAGTVHCPPGETEVVISLAIPVVTSSLIIKFEELHENRQNNELHCPRCSAVVQPNPGVCENCGENAFQCVKCRAINYDEKDPFLCQACGFCKFARMDISVLCRSLPGVQPITSDSERNSGLEAMSKLLVDMEHSRSQLHTGRSLCESLWLKTRPLVPLEFHLETNEMARVLTNSLPPINPNQHSTYGVFYAHNYCNSAHEELCTMTQQLIALREELRNFDHASRPTPLLLHQAINQGFYSTSSQCFGCLCASILHSLAILQGICDEPTALNKVLDDEKTYRHLAELGARYDPLSKDIEGLLCRLAFENEKGTNRLCELVSEGVVSLQILSKSLISYHDSFWQRKLKTLFQCTVESTDEDATLSCLLMIERLMSEGRPIRRRVYKKLHHTTGDTASTPTGTRRRVRIRTSPDDDSMLRRWLLGKEDWSSLRAEAPSTSSDQQQGGNLIKEHEAWFWRCVFSSWISVRSAACKLLIEISRQPGHQGAAISMILDGIVRASVAPPTTTDHMFHAAYDIIRRSPGVKARLFLEGVHVFLMQVIHKECRRMYEEEQQETSMDHHFGTVLRGYTELLSLFFNGSAVEAILLKAAADHLLVPVLQSTIYLKRVVLRRTRPVDAARFALEDLLRRLSAKEPLTTLKTAVSALDCTLDFHTQTLGTAWIETTKDPFIQAQIVSIVMDILNPEQQKDDDFLLQIDKDPAQEDFLQGRMTSNPYKSTDSGFGPLMRDIKNKVCRDTEMIALLEDDNGMELLVNNQIISLSLPVAAVYDKLWRRVHPGQPMTIVYRMRGLLGDAVEPFVSTLGDGDGANADDESGLSSLVDSFVSCGGITRSLQLIQKSDVTTGGRMLLNQMRRLMEHCVKTEKGREEFVKAGAVAVFMKVLQMCVDGHQQDEGILTIGQDYLSLMSTLVTDVNTHKYLHHLTATDAAWLIKVAMRRGGAGQPQWKTVQMNVMNGCSQLLGNAILGTGEAEDVLVEECKTTLYWTHIDTTNEVVRRSDYMEEAERLAEIVAHILPSKQGIRLKNKILESGVITEACNYMLAYHPPLYSATETAEWKHYLMKPSLKLMLTFMNSMAKGHEATQQALAEKTLHLLHRLEQVASDNSIGTLAENVMESLKQNDDVAAKIEKVRQETKQKKRQMAMAMRNKQLTKMGMQIGKQGEVKVAARKIANEPVLDEVKDPLAACCICRDTLLLGDRPAAAYAFASMDRGQLNTVSQMVLVHLDCHLAAIRRSGGGRNSDEWSKASLHNAGALCNAMTPIACCDLESVAWTQAILRFQTDLDVVAPTPQITRAVVFSDMCQLMDRFVSFASFSELSHGGGRESNAQYLSILHLLACALPPSEDLPARQPHWRLYSFLMTELSLASWNENRSDVLRASLDEAATTDDLRNWQSLRNICITWAFVDAYFRIVIPIADAERLEWLKKNLMETFSRTLKLIHKFDEIATCTSFAEFAEVTDLMPAEFATFFDLIQL